MYEQSKSNEMPREGGRCKTRSPGRAAPPWLDARCIRGRRGATMLVAMVCLVLVTMLLGALLRLAMTQRRQVAYEQMRLQADWLAEAAVERAVHRLASDGNYTGETWTFTSEELGGVQAGEATIQVGDVPEESGVRQIVVRATYPTDAVRFATRTKQIQAQVAGAP